MRNYLKILGWVLLTAIFLFSVLTSLVGLVRAITGNSFPIWVLIACSVINLLALSYIIYHDKYSKSDS